MNLYMNGKKISTTAKTLSALLEEQHFDLTAIACAVEGEFVPRTLYSNTLLEVGQKIEVLAPMQGG